MKREKAFDSILVVWINENNIIFNNKHHNSTLTVSEYSSVTLRRYIYLMSAVPFFIQEKLTIVLYSTSLSRINFYILKNSYEFETLIQTGTHFHWYVTAYK